jgi:hemoglobin-like flavoprotein
MEVTKINTPSCSQMDTILQSLSAVADREEDITARVYESYFGRCPGSAELMVGTDGLMKGRMMQEVLTIIMAEDLPAERSYLCFETKTHRDYGVEPHMYENLLLAVRDTVKEVLGADWDEAYELAWSARIETLMQEISDAWPRD